MQTKSKLNKPIVAVMVVAPTLLLLGSAALATRSEALSECGRPDCSAALRSSTPSP